MSEVTIRREIQKPEPSRQTKKIVKPAKSVKKTSSDKLQISPKHNLDIDKCKQIIKLLLKTERLDAVTLFKTFTDVSTTEAVNILKDFWDNKLYALLQESKFIKEFAPDKCCLNCVGCCGMKQSYIDKGIVNSTTNTFVGHDCSSFYNKKQFTELFKNKHNIVLRSNNGRHFRYKRYAYDNTVVQITNKDSRGRLFREHANPTSRITIIPKNKIVKHFIKLFDRNFKLYSDNILTENLLFQNIKPKKGETYSQYLGRASEKFRQNRLSQIESIKALSKMEAENKIYNMFVDNGLDETLKEIYGNNLTKMLEDFYPEKDVYDILISLTVK